MPENIIGEHNYKNATTAIATCRELKISIKDQLKALSSFKGVNKRTDFICEVNGVKIFDDFAHHPTAIRSSINSMKETFKGQKAFDDFYSRFKFYEIRYT